MLKTHVKSKTLVFFTLVLILGCHTGGNKPKPQDIYGTWKYVKHNRWHATKYTSEQLDMLKSAVLKIGPDKAEFAGLKFIEPCAHPQWAIARYDTSYAECAQLEPVYTMAELAKMFRFTPIDSKGEWNGCFPDCSVFYLKQDTLINIWGGFPVYFVRKNN